jgi:hypothetical protein
METIKKVTLHCAEIKDFWKYALEIKKFLQKTDIFEHLMT